MMREGWPPEHILSFYQRRGIEPPPDVQAYVRNYVAPGAYPSTPDDASEALAAVERFEVAEAIAAVEAFRAREAHSTTDARLAPMPAAACGDARMQRKRVSWKAVLATDAPVPRAAATPPTPAEARRPAPITPPPVADWRHLSAQRRRFFFLTLGRGFFARSVAALW